MQKLLPILPRADGRRSLHTCGKSMLCCKSTKYHWQTDDNFGHPAKSYLMSQQACQGTKRKLDALLPAAHNVFDGSARWPKTCHCLKTKIQSERDGLLTANQAGRSLSLAYVSPDEPYKYATMFVDKVQRTQERGENSPVQKMQYLWTRCSANKMSSLCLQSGQ